MRNFILLISVSILSIGCSSGTQATISSSSLACDNIGSLITAFEFQSAGRQLDINYSNASYRYTGPGVNCTGNTSDLAQFGSLGSQLQNADVCVSAGSNTNENFSVSTSNGTWISDTYNSSSLRPNSGFSGFDSTLSALINNLDAKIPVGCI